MHGLWWPVHGWVGMVHRVIGESEVGFGDLGMGIEVPLGVGKMEVPWEVQEMLLLVQVGAS